MARIFIGAGVAGFLVGGVLLIIGWWIVGLLLIVAAVAVLWRGFDQQDAYRAAYDKSMPKPPDSLIDRVLDRELRGVEQRALARLALTAEDLELESVSWDPVAQSAPGNRDDDRLARKPWMVLDRFLRSPLQSDVMESGASHSMRCLSSVQPTITWRSTAVSSTCA
jgi:hypothetical protein